MSECFIEPAIARPPHKPELTSVSKPPTQSGYSLKDATNTKVTEVH